MKQSIVCWRCGTALRKEQLPISRLEECRHCHAELHVCRMCRSWNPRYTSKCSHDNAEPPQEKERANFCQYFKPATGAYHDSGKYADATARADLESLFGGTPAQTEESAANRTSESEQAHRELDALFGTGQEDDTQDSG